MQENLFSQRLKTKMKEHSLRKIEILRAAENRGIKLGKSHVSQYVSGKTIPRDNIISFLADILETDIQWLKGTDSSAEPETPAAADNLQSKSLKKLHQSSLTSFHTISSNPIFSS